MIPELKESRALLEECAKLFKTLQKKGPRPDVFDLGIHIAELLGRQQYLEALCDSVPQIESLQDIVKLTKQNSVLSIATLYAWINRHGSEVTKLKGRLDESTSRFISEDDEDKIPIMNLWQTYATSGLLVGGLVSLYAFLTARSE